MAEQFDGIETKLLKLATNSEDAYTISKAVQAVHAVRALRKDKSRRAWPSLITALTPVLAILITAITLGIQTSQTNRKVVFEQDQAEESEWRDVLKNISLRDSDSVEMGLFTLQGFFDSKSKHAAEARSVAVALLPLTSNEDGFDIIFARLHRATSDSNRGDLYGIGRKVAENERESLKKAFAQLSDVPPGCVTSYPDSFLSREKCFPEDSNLDSTTLKSIWLYSWEIGSVSDGLVKLWNRPDGTAKLKGENLSGVILDGADLSGIDFSGAHLEAAIINDSTLSGVHFDNAFLNNATFRSVKKFEDASWDQANWWDAASLSCDLAQHLDSKYPPSDKDSKTLATRLFTASCPSK